MNTQYLSTLQVSQSFPQKCKSLYLQFCPKFIRFCECIVNLLKGNLLMIKRHHVTKFQNEVRSLFLKRITWKQRIDVLASGKGLQNSNYPSCHKQFLLTWNNLFSSQLVFNQSLNTQAVTKQELPKYQDEQIPTNQIYSLQKEINKKLFAKADSIVDKTLSCPRIKLSESQTVILDGVETGVLRLDFAQQLRRTNADVPDIYLTLLVYLQLCF